MSQVRATQMDAGGALQYPRLEQHRPEVDVPDTPRRGVEAAAVSSPKAEPSSSASIQETIDKLNAFAAQQNISLKFSVDKTTGRTIIRVIDEQTQKVVRQLPPEEVLELAANMEEMVGALVSHNV